MPGPKKNNSFIWDVPCHIVKGDKDKPWLIEGIASTPDRDSQGEVIDQKGLDITNLKSRKGYFNEDHKPGIEHKVGKITDANVVADKGLFVKGYLFKKSPKAKAFRDIMSSLQKGDEESVRMSIEGKVLKRGPGNTIQRAKITGVALTLNPINENTYAKFVKALDSQGVDSKEDYGVLELAENKESLESAIADCGAAVNDSMESSSAVDSLPLQEIDEKFVLVERTKLAKAIKLSKKFLKSEEDKTEKAIATGNYNAPPGELSQGAAWSKESLERKKKLKKRLKKSEEERRNFTTLFKKLRKSYPSIDINKVMELTCVIYEDKKDKLFSK